MFYEILAALSSSPDKTDEILLHALAYISENYGDPEMKLSDVCRAVGTSESSLRRRFYDRYGVSPVDYVIEYRLDRACDLLSARNATVAETAEKCGFSEPKYLSRIMKKRRGFSPSSLKIKVL
ncbi:MAG: helix-turn-helix domain-containing protein [Christensenellales bacterium]